MVSWWIAESTPHDGGNIARSQGGVRRRPVYPRGFRTITPANLEVTTQKIGATQAALRAAHLKYHLSTVAILTREQVTRYNELRGYKAEEGPTQHHHQMHQ
jgi:hypothetical protein